MGKLVEAANYRPHVMIEIETGDCHVLPVSVLEKFASGEMPLSEIDDGEKIIRAIIKDWLRGPW